MENTPSPWIKTVSLAPPSLQDNTADTERLISALRTSLQTDAPIRIDLDLIKRLPDILRQNDFSVRCTVFKDDCQWQVIGASATVQPAALMPGYAKESGAKVVEINPEKTPLTLAISDYLIVGKAGEVMNRILLQLERKLNHR
jgi:hypothetical protein